MNQHAHAHSRWIALSICLALISACGEKAPEAPPATPASGVVSGTNAVAAQSKPAQGAAITVVTTPAQQRNLGISLQSIGTVVSVASVEVKAQTTGVVTKVLVQEGQTVQKGSLLFTLDARADEANMARLRAQMAKNEFALADAQRQLVRAKDLVAKGFVSQGATDTNQAQVDGLSAAVASDRAALDSAALLLSYTRVVAPASGRLGAIALAPGSAVQANLTPLVTLTQLNPINVSFSLPQRNLASLLAGLKSGGASVSATLPEGKGAVVGRLQFVDNAVDAATGTVKVKARFDNKGEMLWPGAFVNVSLIAETLKDAIVIPTSAINQTARGAMVYINDNGKAAARPLQVVVTQGDETVVTGLKAGDRVVTEGRQNVRPDAVLVEREPGAADKK